MDLASEAAAASPERLPWLVGRSSPLVQDAWITLRSDDCTTPTGHVIEPYYVLDYPDWVTAFVVDHEGMVVLIEQYRHGAGVWTTEFICGGQSDADEQPQAAAEREVAEETGLTGGRWWPLGSAWVNAATHSNRNHYFLAVSLSPTVRPSGDPAEVLRICRLPMTEVLGGAGPGHLGLPALHLACLPLLREWLGSDDGRAAAVDNVQIQMMNEALCMPSPVGGEAHPG